MGVPSQPVDIEHFGGLCTLSDRTDLETGLSPDCHNVVFFPGRVQKRPGLTSLFSALSGTPKVNGISYAKLLDGTGRALVFTSDGKIYDETGPQGTLNTTRQTNLGVNLRMQSVSAYGREYMAIGTGQAGAVGLSYVADIKGQGQAFYTNFSPEVPFGASDISVSEGATANVVTPGLHYLKFVLETVDGGLSYPSSGAQFLTSTGYNITLSMPVMGLPLTTKFFKVFMTTADPAGGVNDYYFEANLDWTGPTSWVVTGTDDYLLNRRRLDQPGDSLYARLIPSPPSAVFGPFDGRLAIVGCANSTASTIPGKMLNRYFATYNNTTGVPFGWTSGGIAGGSMYSSIQGATYGSVYRITGDGSTANRGLIYQKYSSGVDPLSGQINFRVRARRSAGLVAGGITVYADVPGGTQSIFNIPFSSLTTEFQVFEGVTTAALWNFGLAHPTDNFNFYLSSYGTMTNNETVEIDFAEPYEARVPRLGSTIFWTNAAQPGDLDGGSAGQVVSDGDGQEVRVVFQLAGRKFAVKDRSLYVIIDSTALYPANWPTVKLADDVGTLSHQGVGIADEFAVICGRQGAYVFFGGGITEDQCLTSEIRPDWNAINWQYGYKITCRVDTVQKRVFISVPYGAATEPNRLYVLDYTDGWLPALSAPGRGRKWSIWDISANSIALVERTNGTRQVWFGNNAGTGKLYKLDDAALSDDGTAIDAYYETSPAGFGYGPNLLEKITAEFEGSGRPALSILDWRGDETVLPFSPVLQNPASGITRVFTHALSEKFSFKIRTNDATSFWILMRLGLWLKPWRTHQGRPKNP